METQITAALNGSQTYPRANRLWTQAAAALLVVVELCWVVPWFETLIRISRVPPALETGLVFALVMYAAYWIGQGLERLRLVKRVKLGLLAVWLAAGYLISLRLLLGLSAGQIFSSLASQDPGSVLVLFFVIWLWWRGFSLAGETLRPSVAARRFFQGLLFYLVHVLIADRVMNEGASFGGFAFFLFVGLVTLVLTRIAYVGQARGVLKNPFDRGWLGLTVLIITLTVGSTVLAGALLTGQYHEMLFWLAEGIKLVLAVVIFIVSLPGLFASNLLGPLIDFLRRGLNQQPTILTNPDDPYNQFLRRLNQAQEVRISPTAQALIFWGLIAFVVLTVLLVAYQRLSSQIRRGRPDDWSEALLRQGEARQILRRSLDEAVDGLIGRLRGRRREWAAARIRRIYAQLLDLCDELNRPRGSAQTPLEFEPKMGELFPALGEDLDRITEAYLRIRYGELPERPDEAAQVEASWRRIEAEGQRLKKAGVGKLKTAEVEEVQKRGI